MRLRIVGLLFLFGVLVAACGGGGKSGVIPATSSGGSGSNSAPSTAKTTHATMSLYVPPPSKQASARKPFYISSSTQAFAVYVEPYPSVAPTGIPSPLPTGIQIFPVATPSPCAAASGGGESCTFTVTAPIGTDLFVVAALPAASINPNGAPLSAVISGPVTIGGSATAAPLSFTLDGVVNSASVTVASPDPGNTPNTQVFSAGVPTAVPLGMTAYDANGNIVMSPATQPYFTPIVIEASPASDGLTLTLAGSSPCGSSASGATATIACAADLNDVQVDYDGTPRPDASDHLIDAFTVQATANPNPTLSPANYVLASNELQWQLASGVDVDNAYIGREASGAFWYAADTGENMISGTWDPSTQTSGTTGSSIPAISGSDNFAVASDGSVWVNDNGPLDCYTSLAGGTPPVSGVYPVTSTGDEIWPTAVAVDNTGNVWYVGYDNTEAGPYMYAGYFPGLGCAAPNPNPPVAQFSLSNDMDDSPVFVALPNGSLAMATATYYSNGSNGTGGIYLMSTASSSPIAPLTSLLTDSPFGYGVAGDGAGTTYVGFYQSSIGNADVETIASGSSTVNELLQLPPSPAPSSLPVMDPQGLNAFSPSGGAADRLEYVDLDYAALGLIESVPASPMPLLVSLPNSAAAYAAVYSSKGAEYVLDMDASENLNIVRVLPTRTWWVPNVTLNSACSSSALLTILERGDSGPFTVSILGTGITATQLPGADHDFFLTGLSNGTFTATVTDAHGRSEQFSITSASSYVTCGATHRRLRTHRP